MSDAAILTQTADESKAINEIKGPKVIISASGMASGGRVLHHLAQYISDPKNAIVLVGYQAAGTRGRSLLEGAQTTKLFGQEYAIKAKVLQFSDLSAHADYKELIEWLKLSNLHNPHVFLTHGEDSAREFFKEQLIEAFHWQHIELPKDGSIYEL